MPSTDDLEYAYYVSLFGAAATSGLTLQDLRYKYYYMAIQGTLPGGGGSGGGGIPPTLIDAKGDLIVGSADDTAARLAVGANTQVLTADSAAPLGMKWAASAAGSAGGVNEYLGFGAPSVQGWNLPYQTVFPLAHYPSTLNSLNLVRFDVATPIKVSGLATNSFDVIPVGAIARVGIYAGLNATGPVPGTEWTFSLEGSTSLYTTFAPVTLPAGEYWTAVVVQGAGPVQLRVVKLSGGYISFDNPHNAFGNEQEYGLHRTHRTVAGVSGALPNLTTATKSESRVDLPGLALLIGV